VNQPEIHLILPPKWSRKQDHLLAVLIGRIATGEVEDKPEDDGKDKAAQALGKKGGAARAASMTPERRAEIARKAAAKRWAKE
jgi:hypothetical protein